MFVKIVVLYLYSQGFQVKKRRIYIWKGVFQRKLERVKRQVNLK